MLMMLIDYTVFLSVSRELMSVLKHCNVSLHHTTPSFIRIINRPEKLRQVFYMMYNISILRLSIGTSLNQQFGLIHYGKY